MTDVQPVSKRDVSIDFLKGVLIVLMVYGHTAHTGTLRVVQDHVRDWIYSFHMEAFLMLSGFFFLKRLQAGRIIGPLLSRLALPYAIFQSLYLVALMGAEMAGVQTTNAAPAAVSELLRILMFEGQGAFWFIHSLIIMQLVFAVARYLADWFPGEEHMLWFLALALLGGAIALGLVKSWVVTFFLMGLILAALEEPLQKPAGLALLIAALCLLLTDGQAIDFSVVQLAWVWAVVGIGLWGAAMLPSVIKAWFSWLGQNTLILLVTHAIFTVGLKPLAGLLTQLEPTGFLFQAVVVIVSLMAGVAVARLLDTLRLSRWLFGVEQLYVPLRR